MNTHQLWLKQLQEQVGQRKEKGQFTTTEMNQKQFENRKPLQEEPQQLDELLPLAGMAAGWLAKKAAGAVVKGVAKKAIKGVGALAAGAGRAVQGVANAVTEEEEKFNAVMEEIAYSMIEELEEQIGRRLTPEEIEEFVENNYDAITEATNQVTAHAIPGDKNTGVGATPPQEPTSKPLPPLKAKASTLGKKTSGTEY